MPTYVFRVQLLPNPPLGFEPDEPVWRDIAIDGEQTLAAFHDAIFEAFERRDTHGYEFLTRDADGIVTRSYVPPQLYDGGPSWPPMDDAAIERFIDQQVPDDATDAAKDRFRDLRSNPPDEGNTAETTIDDVDPETMHSLYYEFDLGDGWGHHIECRAVRTESAGDTPTVVDQQGPAPSQSSEGA